MAFSCRSPEQLTIMNWSTKLILSARFLFNNQVKTKTPGATMTIRELTLVAAVKTKQQQRASILGGTIQSTNNFPVFRMKPDHKCLMKGVITSTHIQITLYQHEEL